MRVLVINSGSSSLKYTLFEMDDESVLFSGVIDRIGLSGSSLTYRSGDGTETVETVEIKDQGHALDEAFRTLMQGPIDSLGDLRAVAHRFGHGGRYRKAVQIDAEVIAEVRRMTPFIPLHHPAMIKEVEACEERMPHALHVAVFDTWFHWSIPDEAAVYGLPYRYFAEKGYRRTGFHGNSHAYVSAKAAAFLDRPIEELKIISCHLGNGASLCAVDGGRSVDTTLGMTALEGLIMGTRSGDVDPGLMPVIMKEDSLTPDDTSDMLYGDSGLLGISGVSRDMREIEQAAGEGNERACLAVNAFCYRVKRYIGAMLMVLGRCDVLVFAGGIGRNSPTVRQKALEGTEELGFIIDSNINSTSRASIHNPVVDISAAHSRVKILVVRTFEELMMARQCMDVVRELGLDT
ncbi:MAG: acetate kinase [Deltaproteobacteria bacterium]